jgi:hypothetical protein
MHSSAPIQVKIVDGVSFNDYLFYHRFRERAVVLSTFASLRVNSAKDLRHGNEILRYAQDDKGDAG